MFKKKKCKRCGEKISDKYDFCPSCGTKIDDDENWGMLGKNDFNQETNPFENSLFGNAGFGMLNKMLGSAMKMLEKEMQKDITQTPSNPKNNFELYINGKRINPKNIKVLQKQIPFKKQDSLKKQIKSFKEKNFNETQKKEFTKLPREEPQTNIRRLSNKIIYEIQIPGVKSIEDVSIVKLQNSIEIKAITKDKAYEKTIKISFPILDYKIQENNLILELDSE